MQTREWVCMRGQQGNLVVKTANFLGQRGVAILELRGGDEFVANLLSFIVSIPREMQDGKGKRINVDPLPLVM